MSVESNNNFENGYTKVKDRFSNIIMNKEKFFKKDLISLIDKTELETVFFVDDDIFKNHIDFNDNQKEIFDLDNNILCRSLRLSKYLKRCYPPNITYTKIPIFQTINKSLVFNWKGHQGDYGYPMSLDGHIFKTIDILPIIIKRNFRNPNSLEDVLYINPIDKPYMICYEQSIIVNNPCNIVQTNNPNIHGDEDINELNKQYLNNNQISMINIDNINNISCHQEIEIIFEKKI